MTAVVDDRRGTVPPVQERGHALFQSAIVRTPGENFADGLTTATLGVPVHAKAVEQHRRYVETLERCGLRVMTLPADRQHPDSTFVEDTAVLTRASAILTCPGASSRAGEVAGIREPLRRFFSTLYQIQPPGTLDGGDICQAENHFFIGISARTNEEGARQLADLLAREGYTASFVDVRGVNGILHLKSGITYLGDQNLVAIDELAARAEFHGYNLIRVIPQENYAANCVRINEHVLVPAGFPDLAERLQRLGYNPLPLDMSEFQKMDGGLTCLSLRF